MSFEYHEGERAVQERADGVEAARWGAENAIRSELPDVASAFLEEQVMVLVGHRSATGAVWASMLAGRPGLISAPDPRSVLIDAAPVVGDPLAAALSTKPLAVGLLAIEPETRRRMRINGPGRLDGGRLRVATEQVYANCPKYINTRRHEQPVLGAAGAARRGGRLQDDDRALITRADTFFIATTHATTGADVSHRGGDPGFVQVHDAQRLTWPDYRGNSMFMTLGNLQLDARAGLLFADWESGDLLQLSGTAATDWSAARAAEFPGAERVVDFTVAAAVLLPGALRWRWQFEKRSRFSPPPINPQPQET